MRGAIPRALVLAGLILSAALPSPAQNENAPENTLGPWKLANTALFALALGIFLYKTAPKFFNARSADIQKAIQDATGLKMDADLRYSEIDRKMATLTEEVKRMRDASAAEMEREHERLRRETAQQAQRIRQSMLNEIDALRNRGMRQVRQRAALAAIAGAGDRLRGQLEQHESDGRVGDFVRLIERGAR